MQKILVNKIRCKKCGDVIESFSAHDFKYCKLVDGTYEVVGPHFRNNPYGLEKDILIKHGEHVLKGVPRSFDGIREYLENNYIEGIVFWKDQEPKCKIKRSDFGFEWNEKR